MAVPDHGGIAPTAMQAALEAALAALAEHGLTAVGVVMVVQHELDTNHTPRTLATNTTNPAALLRVTLANLDGRFG